MSDQTVSGRTTVDAPPHVVFAILADPRQHPRIDGSGSVQEITTGPDRLSKGAEFGASMKLFGVPYGITNKVVEFEEDRLIAWRHFGGHRWRYELEQTDDGGTVVTETFDYSRHGRVARLIIDALGFPERNRRGIEATLVRLREAAETDVPRS